MDQLSYHYFFISNELIVFSTHYDKMQKLIETNIKDVLPSETIGLDSLSSKTVMVSVSANLNGW